MKKIYTIIIVLFAWICNPLYSQTTFSGSPQSVITQTSDLTLTLPASNAVAEAGMVYNSYDGDINGWRAGYASWQIQIIRPSTLTVYANYTSDAESDGSQLRVSVRVNNSVWINNVPSPGTGGWGNYSDINQGQITLAPGNYTFSMSITGMGGNSVNFDHVSLVRQVVPATLTLSVNNPAWGFVVRTPYKDTYELNDSVALMAVPYPGYKLSSWSGDLSSSNPEDTLVMTGNHAVVAHFIPGGSIFPDGAGNLELPSAVATLSNTGIAYDGTAITAWTTGNASWTIEVPCAATYTIQGEVSGPSTPVSGSLNIRINSLNLVSHYNTPGGGSGNYAFRNLQEVTLQPGTYQVEVSRILTGADSILNLKTFRFVNGSLSADSYVKLTANITNIPESGIDFTNATFEGPWSTQNVPGIGNINVYDAAKTNESNFTPAIGIVSSNPGTNFYQISIPFVSTNNPDCKFTIRTNDGRRFGLWSFNGSDNDTVNIQTYSTVQSYNTGTNTAIRDYKLLALVDGGNNPLRNNKYLSVGNGGATLGGGGLLIVRSTTDGDSASVVLDNTVTPIGSTVAGQLNAGFIVVDSMADFIVSGTLDMQNGISNAIDTLTGPRLIIEKGFNNCGIFALDGGNLNKGDYFMSLYHHVLDEAQWSWLSHPENISLVYGTPVNKLLYASNAASSNRFTSQRTNGANLYIYAYDEGKRATTAPNLHADGVAWDESSSAAVKGFITSIDNNTTSARDLYVQIVNPAVFQNQPWSSVNVSFTQCTRLEPYQKAAAALGKPIPATISAADQETKDLVAAYNSGWNLIGNPYSKSYAPDPDMGTVAIPNSTDGGGHIYQNAQGVLVPNDGNFNSPPLTAFYVQAQKGTGGNPEFYTSKSINITGNLSVENNKILRSDGDDHQEPAIIRIDLLKDGNKRAQTVLSFSEGATPYMDWGMDAMLMKIASDAIYLPDKMGFAMAIQAISKNDNELFSVPIGISISKPGKYEFRISEIKNMPDLGLVLKEGNKETEVHEGDIYPFTVSAPGKNETTFSLARIKQSTGIKENKNLDKPLVSVENNRIKVENIQEESDIRLVDMMGRKINQITVSGTEYTFSAELKGYCIVQIIQKKQIYVFKLYLGL